MNVNLTIKQRVRLVCEKSNITMSRLAKKLGMTASSFSLRLKTGKFTKCELINIANAAGCSYESYFLFKNGEMFSAETNGEQIKCALGHINMSAKELGERVGLTQQAISKRMITGKISQEDMRRFAKHIGCCYISEFRFSDGTTI